MILMTPKDMDSAFASKCIAEHKLNPVPKTGFHADPLYWQETERWKRVVERYDWGAIIFCSDRTRGAHATIVAVGNVDIEGGKVGRVGGMQDIQPGWYKEMAMELRDLKRNTGKLQIPPCLGFRAPDHVCDGGKNPETQKMEPACAWRDRCMALQAFAQEQNRLQEDLLRSKSPEQIVQLTTRLLERKGATVQRPAAKPSVTKPKQTATAVPERHATAVPGPGKVTAAFVASVAAEVAAAATVKLAPDQSRQTAGLGDLYLVDRTEHSDYISLYMANKPRAQALASFRHRPRVGMLVQFPIDKDDELLKSIVPDDVKVWTDGAFKVAVRDVPIEGNRLQHVKHIIVGIIARYKSLSQ